MFCGHHGLDLAAANLDHAIFPEHAQIAVAKDLAGCSRENQPRTIGHLGFELAWSPAGVADEKEGPTVVR